MKQDISDTGGENLYSNPPFPIGRYRHFKGGIYEVLGFAVHTETEEPLVIYQSATGKLPVWARPLSSWLAPAETESGPANRFEPFPQQPLNCKKCGVNLIWENPHEPGLWHESSSYLGDDWPYCHDCMLEHCLNTDCSGCEHGSAADCRFHATKEFYQSVEK